MQRGCRGGTEGVQRGAEGVRRGCGGGTEGYRGGAEGCGEVQSPYLSLVAPTLQPHSKWVIIGNIEL